jgi:hypothetical protein
MPAYYRVSGHESFPCRYAWLPKAVRGLRKNPRLFASNQEDTAMVELGLGKNMVRSLRFWGQVTGVIEPDGGGYKIAPFGEEIFGENGHDPFMEDVSTLWLLHWKLSTIGESPLLAWDFLLNRWQEPDFTPSKAVEALDRELKANQSDLSRNTIEQHLEVFLHTYVPTRSRKGLVQEDNLDCPLVELELLDVIGTADVAKGGGRSESVYAFRREEKHEISAELFAYCLNEFWTQRHANNKTLTLKELTTAHGSPGQVFKLPEEDVRARAEALASETRGYFKFQDSATQQQVHRDSEDPAPDFLARIYDEAKVH